MRTSTAFATISPWGGRLLDITAAGRYEDVLLELHGRHQGDNATLALAAAEAFFDTPVPAGVVSEAFAGAALPGRLEIVGRAPLVVVDGAHNPRRRRRRPPLPGGRTSPVRPARSW